MGDPRTGSLVCLGPIQPELYACKPPSTPTVGLGEGMTLTSAGPGSSNESSPPSQLHCPLSDLWLDLTAPGDRPTLLPVCSLSCASAAGCWGQGSCFIAPLPCAWSAEDKVVPMSPCLLDLHSVLTSMRVLHKSQRFCASLLFLCVSVEGQNGLGFTPAAVWWDKVLHLGRSGCGCSCPWD